MGRIARGALHILFSGILVDIFIAVNDRHDRSTTVCTYRYVVVVLFPPSAAARAAPITGEPMEMPVCRSAAVYTLITTCQQVCGASSLAIPTRKRVKSFHQPPAITKGDRDSSHHRAHGVAAPPLELTIAACIIGVFSVSLFLSHVSSLPSVKPTPQDAATPPPHLVKRIEFIQHARRNCGEAAMASDLELIQYVRIRTPYNIGYAKKGRFIPPVIHVVTSLGQCASVNLRGLLSSSRQFN